jgi:hypothetical protein
MIDIRKRMSSDDSTLAIKVGHRDNGYLPEFEYSGDFHADLQVNQSCVRTSRRGNGAR